MAEPEVSRETSAPPDKAKQDKRAKIAIVVGLLGVIVTYVLYKRQQAASAAGSYAPYNPAGNVAGAGGSMTDPYAESAVSQLGGQLAQLQQTDQANLQAQTAAMSGLQNMISGLQAEISGMQASPATTPTGAPTGPPPDRYALGQVVNPATGEKVVASAWDQVLGTWLNETSMGGIYTSGGNPQLPGQQSYLGYVATLPGGQQATEMALHGQFSGAPGALSVLPGGGYVETNIHGEHYQFGR